MCALKSESIWYSSSKGSLRKIINADRSLINMKSRNRSFFGLHDGGLYISLLMYKFETSTLPAATGGNFCLMWLV